MALVHDLQSSLDCGHESWLSFLDFSSTFDIVNPKALLFTLEIFCAEGRVLGVIPNTSTGGKRFIIADCSFSDIALVKSGVPQGSVLKLLLLFYFFVIYGMAYPQKHWHMLTTRHIISLHLPPTHAEYQHLVFWRWVFA